MTDPFQAPVRSCARSTTRCRSLPGIWTEPSQRPSGGFAAPLARAGRQTSKIRIVRRVSHSLDDRNGQDRRYGWGEHNNQSTRRARTRRKMSTRDVTDSSGSGQAIGRGSTRHSRRYAKYCRISASPTEGPNCANNTARSPCRRDGRSVDRARSGGVNDFRRRNKSLQDVRTRCAPLTPTPRIRGRRDRRAMRSSQVIELDNVL
jgi:hypothetical protein